MQSYKCIQCGWTAKELYRDYKGGVIKIAHCVSIVLLYFRITKCAFNLICLLKKPSFNEVGLH